MARKVRDFKAEYARRQALAKGRGFKSYGAQRYAIEKGAAPAIASWRIKTRRTAEAQQSLLFQLETKNKDAGLYERELRKVSKETQCRDWSVSRAKYSIFKYTPKDARRFGMTKAEYTDLYYKTFIDGDSRYFLVRKKKGDYRHLKRWLVDLHGYMEADEFDEKYTLEG